MRKNCGKKGGRRTDPKLLLNLSLSVDRFCGQQALDFLQAALAEFLAIFIAGPHTREVREEQLQPSSLEFLEDGSGEEGEWRGGGVEDGRKEQKKK